MEKCCSALLCHHSLHWWHVRKALSLLLDHLDHLLECLSFHEESILTHLVIKTIQPSVDLFLVWCCHSTWCVICRIRLSVNIHPLVNIWTGVKIMFYHQTWPTILATWSLINFTINLGYILKFRSPNLYTIIILLKIKKDFLKKKERVKGSLFLWLCYHSSKLNLTTVIKSPANKVVVRLNFRYC